MRCRSVPVVDDLRLDARLVPQRRYHARQLDEQIAREVVFKVEVDELRGVRRRVAVEAVDGDRVAARRVDVEADDESVAARLERLGVVRRPSVQQSSHLHLVLLATAMTNRSSGQRAMRRSHANSHVAQSSGQ